MLPHCINAYSLKNIVKFFHYRNENCGKMCLIAHFYYLCMSRFQSQVVLICSSPCNSCSWGSWWLPPVRSCQVQKRADAQLRSSGKRWCKSAVFPASTNAPVRVEWAFSNWESPHSASCPGETEGVYCKATIVYMGNYSKSWPRWLPEKKKKSVTLQ